MSLRRYAAVTTLFIVPSVIVEFLTGNMTFAVFRDPPSLVMMVSEYGSGAILARELARRWHKGFASILVLGAVYGMFNEGVGTGWFFDPHFYALRGSGLENYGRWGGVNVVWALQITVFHAVFSIAVPITIVNALFPAFADDRLLSDRNSPGAKRSYLDYFGSYRLSCLAPSDPQNPFTHSSADSGCREFFFVLFLISRLLLGLADVSNRQRLALATGAEGLLLAHAIASPLFVPAAITLALLVTAWRSSASETGRRTPMSAE